MLYKEVLNEIILNKENKSKGIYSGIPYPFERLNHYLTSIDKGQCIAVLAGSGLGKTKFTNMTFVYSIYKFYKETGYKCRIVFFCLEDNKKRAMNSAISYYLKEQHNIIITPKELNSKTRELPDFVLEKLIEAESYFEEFEKIVTFIDGENDPDKIYEICKDIALDLGTINKWKENINGKEVVQYSYTSDTHVIGIFDNMSNFSELEGENEQTSILKFAKQYMRAKLSNFFNWTTVLVMQLDFESERQSFTKGESNVNKLEPTLASIGDSKRAARSMHLVFSLFSPHRFDLINYPQPSKANPENTYRIDILGNRFRSLRIIKSNDSETGMRVGLLFDGISGDFKELPQPNTPEMHDIYKTLTSKEPKSFGNTENKLNFVPVKESKYEVQPKKDKGYEPIDTDNEEMPF